MPRERSSVDYYQRLRNVNAYKTPNACAIERFSTSTYVSKADSTNVPSTLSTIIGRKHTRITLITLPSSFSHLRNMLGEASANNWKTPSTNNSNTKYPQLAMSRYSQYPGFGPEERAMSANRQSQSTIIRQGGAGTEWFPAIVSRVMPCYRGGLTYNQPKGERGAQLTNRV